MKPLDARVSSPLNWEREICLVSNAWGFLRLSTVSASFVGVLMPNFSLPSESCSFIPLVYFVPSKGERR